MFQPLGSSYPIFITDTDGPNTGQIVFRCNNDSDRASLEVLARLRSPVLLQAPAGTQDWPAGGRWVMLGDYSNERAADMASMAVTFDTLNWTEVATP